MIEIDPIVNNRDHDLASASADEVPGAKRSNVLQRYPTALPGVVQVPLLSKLWIVDAPFPDLGQEVRRREVDDVIGLGESIGQVQGP